MLSELTVSGEEAPELDSVAPPSLEMHDAANAVIAEPPSPLEVNPTMAELLPRVTPLIVGANGALAATNELDADEAALSPIAFVATTLQV